ncbi:MAG: potassium transporter TrkG [Bacteroidales bacterium]
MASFREFLQNFRERVNLRLFESKSRVLGSLTWLTLIFSLISLMAIVYYYGFPQSPDSIRTVQLVIRLSLWFYIFKYLVRIFYDFHPGIFIRENRLDGIVFLFLVAEQVLYLITGGDYFNRLFSKLIDIQVGDLSILAVQLYFFIIVGVELGKAAVRISRLKFTPVQLLVISFLSLILFGTLLLNLPEMTTAGISFIDSLFTSTSAVCVTGLVVVDTATAFTHKGHWVIMILIQLGGINILAFAAFFAIFYKDSASIKYQSLIKDLLDTSEMSKSRSILGNIVLFTLVIEVVGIVAMYFAWGRHMHFGEDQSRLFYSAFHAISGFNNAGFCLFSNNLFEESIRHNWNVQTVIAVLVFFGCIGYPVLQDLSALPRKKIRWLVFWRHLQPGSRIALRTTFVLYGAGALFFFLFYPFGPTEAFEGERILQSIFHSVMSHTAGFNSVDISQFTQPLMVLFMFLMFIGASPGSTGGGIKTTTFAVLVKSVLSGVRGHKNVTFFKHTLPGPVIQRAVSITLFYALFFVIGTTLLTILEPDLSLEALAFEQISALSTVGLSLGATASLSTLGKVVITLSMFIGRIGTLTIIMALLRKVQSVKYTYAHTNVQVG